MKGLNFRAYASSEAVSRRDLKSGRATVSHDVHDVVAEGKASDDKASFTPDQEVAYVAFYRGSGDEAVCVGRVDGPFAKGKKADVQFVEEDHVVTAPEAQESDEGYRPVA